MKKIFTMVFSLVMLSTAFAQYGQKQQRRGQNENMAASNRGDKFDNEFSKPGHENNGWYVFTPAERDMQISNINRRYENKIREIRYNYFMSWFHKKRQIRILEEQRDQEINMVMYKFNSHKNKFGDFGKRRYNRW